MSGNDDNRKQVTLSYACSSMSDPFCSFLIDNRRYIINRKVHWKQGTPTIHGLMRYYSIHLMDENYQSQKSLGLF